MRLSNLRAIKTIDTYPFGHVTSPITVDPENECLETSIEYGIDDLAMFMENIYFYYTWKAERSQRQSEIADLAHKLAKLLKKEKGVVGRIWSPIKVKN